MRRFFDPNDGDRLERRLRDARPEPRVEFLRELSARLAPPRRQFTGSRLAFSLALTVFLLGSFAAFGGLGYASSGARSVVKIVVHPDQAAKRHSSASAQYSTPPPPKSPPPRSSNVAGASGGPVGQVAGGSTLPFTGVSLAITTVIGFTLLIVGVILRRREKQTGH